MQTTLSGEKTNNPSSDVEKYRAEIQAKDTKFGIQEFDPEETLRHFFVKRTTDGSVDSGWMLTGIGPEVGKLVKISEAGDEGTPPTKYLVLAELEAAQDRLQAEYFAKRAEEARIIGEQGVGRVVTEPIPSVSRPEVTEQDKYSYLRDLLPPVTRPESSKESQSYDILFTKDDNVYQSYMDRLNRPKTPEDKQREYYDRFVTDENRQSAQELLQSAVLPKNPELVRILRTAGLDPASLDAVDAIRENPDVRFQVAKELTRKLRGMLISDPYQFGWRIDQNSPGNLKVDPQTGNRMRSQDYAISIALKMIDGEFSERNESDDFARDESGRVAVGQHRHAARAVLMY